MPRVRKNRRLKLTIFFIILFLILTGSVSYAYLNKDELEEKVYKDLFMDDKETFDKVVGQINGLNAVNILRELGYSEDYVFRCRNDYIADYNNCIFEFSEPYNPDQQILFEKYNLNSIKMGSRSADTILFNIKRKDNIQEGFLFNINNFAELPLPFGYDKKDINEDLEIYYCKGKTTYYIERLDNNWFYFWYEKNIKCLEN